jgi:hypothetical protein
MEQLTVAEFALVKAKVLLDSITFDSDGIVIGGQRMGGNGGLISTDTIRAADELRKVLDDIKRTESEAPR